VSALPSSSQHRFRCVVGWSLLANGTRIPSTRRQRPPHTRAGSARRCHYAALALEVADQHYVIENGRIMLQGPAEALRQNPEVKEFYLGLNEVGARRSYRDMWRGRRRHWAA
jgi:hypothetical protein